MTDFATLSYTSTVKSLLSHISETWKWYPFQAEPARIGHCREYYLEQMWICQLKAPSLHHSISVAFLSFYRIHHNQIVVNKVLVPVIDSLREHAKARVHQLRVSTSFYPFVSLNFLTPRKTNSKFKTIQLVVLKHTFLIPTTVHLKW